MYILCVFHFLSFLGSLSWSSSTKQNGSNHDGEKHAGYSYQGMGEDESDRCNIHEQCPERCTFMADNTVLEKKTNANV